MKRWIYTFSLVSAGLSAFIVAALWLTFGSNGLNIGLNGFIAMALGILVTTGLTVGLMALSFYSDGSNWWTLG